MYPHSGQTKRFLASISVSVISEPASPSTSPIQRTMTLGSNSHTSSTFCMPSPIRTMASNKSFGFVSSSSMVEDVLNYHGSTLYDKIVVLGLWAGRKDLHKTLLENIIFSNNDRFLNTYFTDQDEHDLPKANPSTLYVVYLAKESILWDDFAMKLRDDLRSMRQGDFDFSLLILGENIPNKSKQNIHFKSVESLRDQQNIQGVLSQFRFSQKALLNIQKAFESSYFQ